MIYLMRFRTVVLMHKTVFAKPARTLYDQTAQRVGDMRAGHEIC